MARNLSTKLLDGHSGFDCGSSRSSTSDTAAAAAPLHMHDCSWYTSLTQKACVCQYLLDLRTMHKSVGELRLMLSVLCVAGADIVIYRPCALAIFMH